MKIENLGKASKLKEELRIINSKIETVEKPRITCEKHIKNLLYLKLFMVLFSFFLIHLK